MSNAFGACKLTVAALFTLALAPAAGQERLTNLSGREVTARAVIDALRPVTRTRTRKINLDAMVAAAQGNAAPSAPAAKASLDQIRFEFDSSELTPDGKRILARVGKALKSSELSGLAFVVEGHTDAVGPDEYNQGLSLRRAQSVKRELIAEHGIPAVRLKAVGKGKTELIDSDHPTAAANRRVVFSSVVAEMR